MPFIEENDLLDLHKDIEKAQIINERLLDQIKFKNKDIKRLKLHRTVLMGIAGIFIFGTLALFMYSAGANSTRNFDENEYALYSLDSLDAVRARIQNLRKQNEELSLVKEFYLAKEFLGKEKIYSVQVKSFTENNVALTSDVLTNTLFVKTNPFYAYSIGNFETLDEAQKLRKFLVDDVGLQDAFVASYQDGKRVQIEDPY